MSTAPPPVIGLHHLKLPVADLDVSLAWYVRVMGASHVAAYDHVHPTGERYAVQLSMPALGRTLVELRHDPAQAANHERFDPITWGVEGVKDLRAWKAWLEEQHVKASPVLMGVLGWVLVFEDPDRRFLRLYTYESHQMTDNPDHHTYWLGN